MRNGKYAAAQVQGDVLGGVAAMDTAAVELKLLDLAKLVRTAQECQHQSDVLHGLKEDQLAAGIEALQSQLQHVQRVVWATPGAGTAAAACSSSLLLAQRTDLQALEARLQALEADVARDTATAKEAAAAREQVERMLLERVIALEGSVAGGRAVRSAWAEQQDIRQLRRQLAELTDGVAGALSSLGLQPWLGAAAAEQAGSDEEVLDGSVEAGESGGTYAVDAGVEAEAHRQDQLSPPPAAAARDDSGQTLRRSSASQPLPHLLQEAMERTAQAAAAAAVETYEARAAIQREVDAARVCALVDVVQSLGGAQRALAGQVEQLAGLCPRLLEALQQAKQRPPAVATGVGSDVGAGAAGGARDAQLEEAYMLAAEAGGLMAGLKKVLAEAMVLGADGAVRFSERLDAAVAGDVALQPMLEEAKL
ncbi:hypothetical protein HYH02_005268 [Chlamydomonas schloesseri]|uniref:Uncharacterized protein n=1 Tax=Chlamydomonas schloesseri TaxID=2026947 RepID=A0A835WLD6_9CHLO|nr:hypothetical protein HYH02_005268 [Chlamydomonas schloesseri]|eukprot:KAG2449742.1 hypothetical protein HYH02_005268 [Chlamydomonas schloesseri]